MAAISNDWLGPLSGEFKKPYYKKLYETVKHEYETRKIFPDPDDIFNAFAFTPLEKVKAQMPAAPQRFPCRKMRSTPFPVTTAAALSSP